MILIFDYFETLLKNNSMDFNRGLKSFWDRYYSDKCSFKEMETFGDELFERLVSMHSEGREYAFVKDELPAYAERFGGDFIPFSVEQEADFLMRCNEMELVPDLEKMLLSFSDKGIPMYVISNSSFSSNALATVLDRYGIGKYFSNVWSSADFGRIKPCKDFFDFAIAQVLNDHMDQTRDDIIYVGDTYETDVVGAFGAGIKAAWINRKNETDNQNYATYIISETSELESAIDHRI